MTFFFLSFVRYFMLFKALVSYKFCNIVVDEYCNIKTFLLEIAVITKG